MEKGLPSAKASTKQSSLEALLLYVELDKADPILDDLLQGLSNKQPKIVASTLAAVTALYHAYGVKIVEPKPALKALPKVFGHADKNVRAEASNLAVELYRWLREAMKPLFWEQLKQVQQQDLEKLFEGIKAQPSPKQERLLRSQQAAVEKAGPVEEDEGAAEEEAEEEEEEVRAFDLAEPVDVLSKIPPDFYERMASSKWKDRKEALEALHELANSPRIKDGHFEEIIAILAKSMKDANVMVVTIAANCVDVLAKGLQRNFVKYRSRVMPPILEKFKEKKQSVADALAQALDSIVASTSLSECLEDILEFLKHKNPQVKAETLKLLVRSLKTTRDAPSAPETKSIAEASTKLLTESTEATRAGGAEALGTLMKITGERAMAPYMDSVEDNRKPKVKEYFEAAQVKAKSKPKAAPPPPKAAPATQKRSGTTKKTAPGLKPPVKRASTPTPQSNKPSSPAPKPAASRSIPAKPGSLPKSGLAAPSAGLKKKLPGAGPPPILQSPRRTISPHSEDDSVSAPKFNRGLAGRPLGKPVPIAAAASPPPAAPSGPSGASLAELEDLRADKDRLLRTNDDLLSQTSRLTSQIHELQNQNAQLIEDHTRDVLSIKAKETQLMRARSDAEAAEGTVQRLQRENERLKRELSRAVRQNTGSPPLTSYSSEDQIYRDGTSTHPQQPSPGLDRYDSHRSERTRSYMGSPSEEKENGGPIEDGSGGAGKSERPGVSLSRSESASVNGRQECDESGKPVENWKRATEVTNQLKARIEQMKVCLAISLFFYFFVFREGIVAYEFFV